MKPFPNFFFTRKSQAEFFVGLFLMRRPVLQINGQGGRELADLKLATSQ